MSGQEPRPPGWYPDPWGGDGERYFDGTSWSRDAVDAPTGPPPKRSGARMAWAAGGVVAVAAVAVAVITLGGNGDSSPTAGTSTTTSAFGEGTTSSTRPSLILNSYRKGDCATWDQDEDASSARLVDCSKEHLVELVESERVPASVRRYPTAAEWDAIETAVCGPVVESYLQAKIDPSGRYAATGIHPTEASWARGVRSLHCGINQRGETADDKFIAFTGKVDPARQYQAFAPGTCLPAGDAGRLGRPVPCTQPHVLEITGAVDLTGRIGHAPTNDEMDQTIGADCEQIAAAYLGRPLEDDLWSGWLNIEPESWDAGHRITECTLERYGPDNAPVVLSAPLRTG
jgi:hypothetical protein